MCDPTSANLPMGCYKRIRARERQRGVAAAARLQNLTEASHMPQNFTRNRGKRPDATLLALPLELACFVPMQGNRPFTSEAFRGFLEKPLPTWPQHAHQTAINTRRTHHAAQLGTASHSDHSSSVASCSYTSGVHAILSPSSGSSAVASRCLRLSAGPDGGESRPRTFTRTVSNTAAHEASVLA